MTNKECDAPVRRTGEIQEIVTPFYGSTKYELRQLEPASGESTHSVALPKKA